MKSIEYRCPCCGLQAINMIIGYRDVDLNTLTAEEQERVNNEPLIASSLIYKFTCPISGNKYTVFELQQHVFQGTVAEYKEKYEGVFPK